MRSFLSLVLCAALSAPAVWAFDVSPTQIPFRATRVIRPAAPSREVLRAIGADPVLKAGTELVRFTPDGKHLSNLLGALSEPLGQDVEAGAMAYLRTHATLFNLPNDRGDARVTLVSRQETGDAVHLTYGIKIGDLPVHPSLVKLHVGRDGRICLANGSFATVGDIGNRPVLTAAAAVRAAIAIVGARALRNRPTSEQVIVPVSEREALLAWRVTFSADEPLGAWDVLVRADTGREISKMNQMVFAETAGQLSSGKASVYQTNPLLCQVTVEPISDITGHGLTGKYADVRNEDTTVSDKPDNVHIYPPEDTHFDEGNVYFHINRIHAFLNQLGFTKLDSPMRAVVHYQTKWDNAAFNPQTGEMMFGDGNKLNDLAKEESVCYHEYSHAALNKIVGLFYAGESGAMNEGQADYFAATLSNDPLIGEYAVAKMNKPWLRNLTDKLHYPEDLKGEVHADGRIWGAVLWDLRIALGPQVADLLIHKSLYYLPEPMPMFSHGMDALLAADKNVFGGKYQSAIQDVLAKRGISQTPPGLALGAGELRAIGSFEALHGEN